MRHREDTDCNRSILVRGQLGTVEADLESVVAPDEGLADRLVGEERGVLRDSEFVEGLEACTQEDAGVGEVVDAVLVVVAGL